jgi:hypothetical protein
VTQAQALDVGLGSGGGGIIEEVPRGASYRWISPTNTVDAEMYSDATGLHLGDGVSSGIVSRTLSATRPNQALTNSAAADADFTSIYSIPPNLLTAGRWLTVRLRFSLVTGGTAATETFYLKLGATKVYIQAGPVTPTNSVTRSFMLQFHIIGTAAPGAAVPVDVDATGFAAFATWVNAQAPQNLATNGALTVVPGVTWGSNSNADTLTLVDALVVQEN